MNGFITLDKKILNWEWYKSMNEYKLFTHLLITANFKPGSFRGKQVKRGQIITSLNHLAADSGLSISSVRTALKNLQKTGEILVKSTQLYSIITICKYDTYQDKNSVGSTPINKRTNTRINTQTSTPINNNRNNTNKRKAGEIQNFTPPSLDEVRSYFREHGLSKNPLNFYNDSLGINWKQKAKEYNDAK